MCFCFDLVVNGGKLIAAPILYLFAGKMFHTFYVFRRDCIESHAGKHVSDLLCTQPELAV